MDVIREEEDGGGKRKSEVLEDGKVVGRDPRGSYSPTRTKKLLDISHGLQSGEEKALKRMRTDSTNSYMSTDSRATESGSSFSSIAWSVGKCPPRDMKRLKKGVEYEVKRVVTWGSKVAMFLQSLQDESDFGLYKPPEAYKTHKFHAGDHITLLKIGYSSSRNRIAQYISIKQTEKSTCALGCTQVPGFENGCCSESLLKFLEEKEKIEAQNKLPAETHVTPEETEEQPNPLGQLHMQKAPLMNQMHPTAAARNYDQLSLLAQVLSGGQFQSPFITSAGLQQQTDTSSVGARSTSSGGNSSSISSIGSGSTTSMSSVTAASLASRYYPSLPPNASSSISALQQHLGSSQLGASHFGGGFTSSLFPASMQQPKLPHTTSSGGIYGGSPELNMNMNSTLLSMYAAALLGRNPSER